MTRIGNEPVAPAFNVYTLDQAAGIVDACAEAGLATILQVNAGLLGDLLAPVVTGLRRLADDAPVEVRLHLDHASESEITSARDLPLDSVMIDGSRLPFAENVQVTRRVVELARPLGWRVEGELGRLAGSEDGRGSGLTGAMTDPAEVPRFITETGVDLLAVCIGNVHGPTPMEPAIDLELLACIRDVCSVPLVLHGASGLSASILHRAIELGVAKINVNTEIRLRYAAALAEAGELAPRLAAARKAAREAAAEVLQRLFPPVSPT